MSYDQNKRIKADAAFAEGDRETAFKLYEEGAYEYHDSRCAFNLAFMYYHGYYVNRDYEKARKLYDATSYMLGGESNFNLALMHMRGQGGTVDLEKALSLMQTSAAAKCIHAQMYLGVAYTLGYIFDPVETECISMIPFPRVIYRDPTSVLLEGAGFDQRMEDLRYELIEADQDTAMDMFLKASLHLDHTYAGKEIGQARFEYGRGLVEGFGPEYSPKKGYKMIENAAIYGENIQAMQYLSRNASTARIYGIDTRRITLLLGAGKKESLE